MAMKKSDPKFCPIPFIQLQLNPLGHVSACCFSGEYQVGDIKDSTLVEIWNGDILRKWRREFLEGNIKICEKPMKNFECHKNYQHLVEFVDFNEVQKRMPIRLDLRLNGQCNLECVMCSVWTQPNQLYDSSDLWSIGPEKIFPFLKEVDMLGGEPFIQKDTFRFVDEVSKVNSTCTWSFITNCNYALNTFLKKKLDKLKLRSIHMSIDSLDPVTYSKIRQKGKLEKTLKTLNDYVVYRSDRAEVGKGFALFASMCVQKLNWREIPSFLKYCRIRQIVPIFQR
jgi:cyclic pyranopterin phosphate synthase